MEAAPHIGFWLEKLLLDSKSGAVKERLFIWRDIQIIIDGTMGIPAGLLCFLELMGRVGRMDIVKFADCLCFMGAVNPCGSNSRAFRSGNGSVDIIERQ